MTKGYNSYRGRRSKGRIFVIVLLVLVLAAACVYMIAQRFVVYRDDGTRYIDLPFLRPSEETGGQNDGGGQTDPNMNLVVDQPESGGGAAAPVQTDRRLLGLAGLPADDAALDQLLTESGANGVVYTARDDTGKVYYDSASAQEQAAERSVSAAALSVFCAREDVYTAARFNCFHDSFYASVHPAEAGICKANGSVWSDERSYYWLDPAKEDARRYVTGLAAECAQMGFDELILEDMAYPTGGDQSRISYAGSTMGKTEALALFLQELRAAVTPYNSNIRISLTLDEALLQTGSDETSGLDLAVLLPLVDAVYVPTADPAAAATLLAQYAEDPPALIPVVTEASEALNWYLPAQ